MHLSHTHIYIYVRMMQLHTWFGAILLWKDYEMRLVKLQSQLKERSSMVSTSLSSPQLLAQWWFDFHCPLAQEEDTLRKQREVCLRHYRWALKVECHSLTIFFRFRSTMLPWDSSRRFVLTYVASNVGGGLLWLDVVVREASSHLCC